MKKIIKFMIASMMSMPILALMGCSSAEDAIVPEIPEASKMLKMTLNVENMKTRMVAIDEVDSKSQFSYEWQVGDTLRIYDPTTKKQSILVATTSGNPATFEGNIPSTDINNGDEVSLISSNCVINTADGTASVNISNQIGTLSQVTRHTMFYGKTTATKTGDNITLGTCQLEQKMAILRMNCIFRTADVNYSKLVAFSIVDSNGASVFSKEATCNLSTGNITKTSTMKSYVRATFNEVQQSTVVEGHADYSSAKVYLVVVPAAFPTSYQCYCECV